MTNQISWKRCLKSVNTCKIDVFLVSASWTTRGEKKGAQPISFLTVSYHSLSSHFPADCVVLAWWIIWMESRSLVGPNAEKTEDDFAGEEFCAVLQVTLRTALGRIRENTTWCELKFARFDHDPILQLVSWCSAFCLANLICNCLSINKQINWIAFFFHRQILSVCSKYLSMTERMCVCASVFVYLFILRGCVDPWQKLLCLTAGSVSLLCTDEMCEMRDAVRSDPYMLCTWGCKSNPISKLLLE